MRFLISLGLLSLSACWRSQDTPPAEPVVVSNRQPAAAPMRAVEPSESERALAVFREFRERMCACTDAQCTQQLSDEMLEWSKREAHTPIAPKLTEDEQQQATEIGMELANCMMKANAAGSAPVAP